MNNDRMRFLAGLSVAEPKAVVIETASDVTIEVTTDGDINITADEIVVAETATGDHAIELTAEDALNEGTMRDEVQALTAATARWKQAFESVVAILRNLDKNDPQSQKFLSTAGNLIRGIAQQSGEFESILKKSSGWISHPHHNVREGAVELTTEELANLTIHELDVEAEIVAALAASIIAEESKEPELDNKEENAGKTSKVPSDVSSALNKRVSELKQSLARYGDKGAKQNAVDALEKIADLLKLEDGLTDAAVFYGTLMSPITDLFPPKVVKFIHAAPKKVAESEEKGEKGECDDCGSKNGYRMPGGTFQCEKCFNSETDD